MAEDIIAVFKAETSQYEKALNDLKQNIKATDKSQEDFEKKGVEGQKKVARATADTTKATQELGRVGDKVFSKLDQLTGGAASSIRNMVTATAGLTKGMNVLKVAIASTGIGALVIAAGALVSYFTQTQRGADQVSRAMKGLGAAFSVIVDRASALGETLVNAFTNPLQAFDDLKSAISDFFSGGITGAVEKTKNAFKDLTDEIVTEATAASGLEGELQKLRDAEIALGVERAKARAQIKELNLVAEDLSRGEQERLAAAEQAIAIEQDLQAKREDIASRRVELIREQNSLSENMIEDTQALADAEIELANIAEESLELQTTLNNKLNVIKAQIVTNTQKQLEAEKKLQEELRVLAEIESVEKIERLNVIPIERKKTIEQQQQDEEEFTEYLKSEGKKRVAESKENELERTQIAAEEAEKRRQANQVASQEAINTFGVVTDMYLQQSSRRLSSLDREIENSTGARRGQLEQERRIEQEKFNNLKRAQLAVTAIQEAVALSRAFAELGPIAGTVAAAALAIKFAFLFAQIEEQSFYEGTDYLTRPSGIKPGKDTIPVWANEGEAIIPTRENIKNRGLVKALVSGDVEKYIQAQYVLPQLQAAALSGANGSSMSIDLTKDNKELIGAIKGASRDQIRGMGYMMKQMSRQRKSRRSAA